MKLLLLCACAGLAAIGSASAEPLAVTVRAIDDFNVTSSAETEGPLEFLGGLDVSSKNKNFGGLSGIDMLDDNTALMISDSGYLVRARLVHDKGRLAGLADAEIDDLIPGAEGSKEVGDVEDISIDPGDPSRGVVVRERQANAMLTFALDAGRPTNFAPKVVGAENRLLRSNRGLESVSYAPPASPLAGEIIAIAERGPKGEKNIPGWIAGVGEFTILRSDGYDVSSARFLPDGDLLLLERSYSPGWGIAMRLRRIAGDEIKVGAEVDGEVLLEAGMTSQIDNMEGLAVSKDETGRTIVTLVSDDNYSVLQRTLILQFALHDD